MAGAETTVIANEAATAPEPRADLAVWSLGWRELVRFFRQRTRIVGAVGQPVIFWILFGAGLHGSFQPPEWAPAGMSYEEYFFPGIAVMIVLFTAIFSTISLIEDRREGFLQAVLVAPVPRLSIVLGKISGGAALAVIQTVVFLIGAPLLSYLGVVDTFGINPGIGGVIALFAFLILLSYTLTALGYIIAWPMESTQGFHAIMSVFLLPMWLLSGAFFPGESSWLSWVIFLNPLTYGVAGLRRLLYWNDPLPVGAGMPPFWVCLLVTVAFCAVCMTIAVRQTCRPTARDSR